jgi:hypothetical protein
MARAWHRAIAQCPKAFGVMHAEDSWRAKYQTSAAAIMAQFEPEEWLRVADAVCEYFWLAPHGPIGSKRVLPGKANPGLLAKYISRDIDAATAWHAQRKRQPEAAQ